MSARAFGGAGGTFLESLAVAGAERLQSFLQLVAVGGEILIHSQRISQRNDRDQIGGSHLLVHVVLRRGGGSGQFRPAPWQ